MAPRTKITKEGDFDPHKDLYHAAGVLLKHSVEDEVDGSYYSLMASLMMSAFCMEAYLNHVGPQIEKGWEDFDRAPVLAKLRHVYAVLGIEPDFGSLPLQDIDDLFAFRNKLAHPRSEPLREEYEVPSSALEESFYEQPRPKWMKIVSADRAKRARESVREVVETINSELDEPALFALSGTSWLGSAKSAPQEKT